jgi:hypothetical protein
VLRASATLAGSDAFVEIARRGHDPVRLVLGDELDGRLLTFVGTHPVNGRLKVVFEGPAGACSAEPALSALALHREDERASLVSAPDPRVEEDGAWSATKGRAAEAGARVQFALAIGGPELQASDFEKKAPQGAERAR